MQWQKAPDTKKKKYTYQWSGENRQEEEIIPLLMGGSIVIDYLKPEKVESPWDDDSHNGPQAT